MEHIIHPVFYGDSAYQKLEGLIGKNGFSKCFILTDENTQKHCLPLLKRKLDTSGFRFLNVKAGESSKCIENSSILWNQMLNDQADRNSLIINLGGGMISDIGGFVASVFKRGIPFINIPTTLLGMVDAAIGGKTGINFHNHKNQIGSFSLPEMVLIDTRYLKSLDQRQIINGMGEVYKYGLVSDPSIWEKLNQNDATQGFNDYDLISKCVDSKLKIVSADFKESGFRKILNFGHTVGHALESTQMQKDNILYHGEAVMLGMIVEAYLSVNHAGLSHDLYNIIRSSLKNACKHLFPLQLDYDTIMKNMTPDKKNVRGKLNFTLIHGIGKASIDHFLDKNEVLSALKNVLS